MLDAIFRLLFNYRPVVFQQGEFRLVPTTGSYVAAAFVLVAIGLTVLTYRRSKIQGNARHRAVLVAIRLATLGVVLLCLFRPVLIVKAAVPQQNFLGVLVDDSRSMFEDNDPTKRLIAVANFNNDLGEYWEFSDQGVDPVDLSNEAYKFGVNYFIYALIH